MVLTKIRRRWKSYRCDEGASWSTEGGLTLSTFKRVWVQLKSGVATKSKPMADLPHDPNFVYELADSTSLRRELDDLTREGPTFTCEIDSRTFTSKHAILASLARALHFPDYFGFNWDAVDECLRDLSWITPADCRILVIITNCNMFQQEGEAEMGMLKSALETAAEYWKQGPREFCAFMLNQ